MNEWINKCGISIQFTMKGNVYKCYNMDGPSKHYPKISHSQKNTYGMILLYIK